MVVLITGIAGFIGSHLGERLLRSGHTVIGIDNFDSFYPRKFKESNLRGLKTCEYFKLYEADVTNKQQMDAVFRDHPINVVIHLAAKAGVRPSIEHVANYYEVNINGTVNILECMREKGISKLLFASSSSVYGNNTKVPFSEEDAVDYPISPYAATKKSGELLCHVYNHLYGFDITCLRFFTVFGPRQRPDLAIHKFIRLVDQKKPLPFYGDGETARDYTYIDDIVDGVICALDNLRGYRIYNLGESRVVKLNELINVIGNLMKTEPILNRLPSQPGDVMKTYASIEKAKREIGYSPNVDIETGIQKFLQWYEDNKSDLYGE